ncbi:hypothetical protein GV67_13415 [Pseudorhizobium pelagicum]|uniref:Uncharacterized protein n=1 Tax=Pseudorhizobium pelagicum TaxID=1509405 RepID=A0A922T562_9HYPH|nr:hypothetical protein GV67_13415 [Pseudorhizobium pelagicum]KEQ04028.1 hypothetical protein GV68_14315 [Pseudorhizobium pelagicum]
MPLMLMAFEQIIDRAARHTLDMGFLDHRRQSLLSRATRFEKSCKIATGAKLRYTKLDSASSVRSFACRCAGAA